MYFNRKRNSEDYLNKEAQFKHLESKDIFFTKLQFSCI